MAYNHVYLDDSIEAQDDRANITKFGLIKLEAERTFYAQDSEKCRKVLLSIFNSLMNDGRVSITIGNETIVALLQGSKQ